MPRQEKRAYIPKPVRQELWIAAAGRCEFRGCARPVDRDFLTKQKCLVGELAHIVADSPDGTRGISGDSERLAKDPANLMLACLECHDRIDRRGKRNSFTTEQLLAMKREHEARVQLIYSATGARDSLPILMSFPIGQHIPLIDIRDVHYAMLQNSGFTDFPVAQHIHIDKSDFDVTDDMPDFWPRAEQIVTGLFQRLIQPALSSRDAPRHLTIAAFAPIPILMKLGALLGDKIDASILDLPLDRWLWDTRGECSTPKFECSVPAVLPREVAVLVSITNQVVPPGNFQTIEFKAVEPNRAIIRSASHVRHFRQEFNAFLISLVRAGARVLHLYPATPLCASVEIGRMILPKTFEELHVWEWQAPVWKPALRLK